ncbi:MAG: hypothetical protein PUE08_02410 [Eubacteriales bacterium]|nr:hypothetical protein [Eubacteriales bacterium]
MKKTIISVLILLAVCFSEYSVYDYNSYDAKVAEDYSSVEYGNALYVKADAVPEDVSFDNQLKAYQKGNSVFSQWLVSPMCRTSNDGRYIQVITEDDTISPQTIYYEKTLSN